MDANGTPKGGKDGRRSGDRAMQARKSCKPAAVALSNNMARIAFDAGKTGGLAFHCDSLCHGSMRRSLQRETGITSRSIDHSSQSARIDGNELSAMRVGV
jgi:hypothetical protein